MKILLMKMIYQEFNIGGWNEGVTLQLTIY